MKSPKKLLLSFIRRFYNPNLQYIDDEIEKWVKSLMNWIIELLLNGFILYVFFVGLIFLIPSISSYINLGSWKEFPAAVIYLGWVFWVIKGTYHWLRIKYKGGTK